MGFFFPLHAGLHVGREPCATSKLTVLESLSQVTDH